MNMDIKEAMTVLSDGHAIVTPEYAEDVCQAVGVPFERKALVQRHYSDPPGTLKGLTMKPEHEGSEGVYSLTLSGYVAKKLGVADEAGTFIGRGFQAQAYARAIARKLGEGH